MRFKRGVNEQDIDMIFLIILISGLNATGSDDLLVDISVMEAIKHAATAIKIKITGFITV